jgi:hypothetical protein
MDLRVASQVGAGNSCQEAFCCAEFCQALLLAGDYVRTVPESDGLELKVAYISFSRSLAEVRRLL